MSEVETDGTVRWQATGTFVFEVALGDGVPHATWGSNGTPPALFEVPQNATTLTVFLNGTLVNASRPGVGYATFNVGPNGSGDRDYPNSPSRLPVGPPIDVTPEESVSLVIEAPEVGMWSTWLIPKGAVVNQAFILTVIVDGEGTPSSSFVIERGEIERP